MVRRQISRLKSLLAVFALLTLGACAAGYNIPKSNVNLADGFPPDAEAVASAIVEMLSGRNPSDTLRVRLAPGAGSGATDDSMDYRGFKLTGQAVHRRTAPDFLLGGYLGDGCGAPPGSADPGLHRPAGQILARLALRRLRARP